MSNDYFDDLIHNVPGAVCLYRFNGKHLEPVIVSDRYSEMLGADAEKELNSMTDLNFRHVHSDDLEMVKKAVLDALVKTHKLDCTYRSYNDKLGKYIWINVQGKAVEKEDGYIYAYVLYTDITRDKDIEQKLRTNEIMLETAAKNAGIWYWNCHWRENLAYISKRFQKDFNLPAIMHDFCDEMCSRSIIDLEYQQIFCEMCDRIIHGEKEAEAIVKGHFADGTTHWMRFKLCNVFDVKGNAVEAVGIMNLVDDMKELERKYEIEKKHGSEDKNLIAHCCINVSTWDIIEYSGSYIYDSGEGTLSVENLGQSIADEIKDQNIKEKICRLHNRDFLLNSYAEGNFEYSYEYQRTLSDGKCIWVNSTFHILIDQNGTDILLFEYCYNINFKKTLNILTEFAVNDDYDLMGFANTQDKQTIMVYGKNSFNPYGANILEDDYEKSLQIFAQDAVVDEDRDRYYQLARLDNVAKFLEDNDNLEFYFKTRNDDGEIRTKKVRYLKYMEDESCIIFIQSDITSLIKEQKKNQDTLEHALESARIASSAKTSFLSQMSHEIRTPMNAIIGMTKLAKQTDNLSEINEYLDKIDSSSHFLLGIINDILDMSRIESGKLELHPQWTDACRVIMDCIEMLQPAMDEKHIDFQYPNVFANSSVRFWVDPLRLSQIYMNLLNNAIKFTPEGGTIKIEMKNIYHDDHKGMDRISISDTGCGMSKEFLTRIFKPFEMEENIFSPKLQGTGLGLALVKSFIDKMGGKIWVESELGKGSVFTFEIPYEAKIVDAGQDNLALNHLDNLNERRILLVDDHPLNREIAKKLLEHEGAMVVTAVDGYDAVDAFSRCPDNFFDAILMDIRMPRMDGLEAAKKIRKMDKDKAATIPIIAMTANAFDEDVQRSINAGMNAHLAKPIEPEKLVNTLAQFMKDTVN